jgi:TPR repeat protein
MADVKKRVDSLEGCIKHLRRYGFMAKVGETKLLTKMLGCLYASDEHKASCFIMFVQKFADTPSDAEILLVSVGLVEGYDAIKGATDRLLEYYKHYKHRHPETTWKAPDDSLRDIGNRAIDNILEKVAKVSGIPALLADAPQTLELPPPQYYKRKPDTEDSSVSMWMSQSDGAAIAEQITGSITEGNREVIESLGGQISQISEALSESKNEHIEGIAGIITAINSQGGQISQISEALSESKNEHIEGIAGIIKAIDSQGGQISQISEALSESKNERVEGIASIIKAINSQGEEIKNQILEEAQYSRNEQEPTKAVGDFPLFIASSFWFSCISSKSERNQVLYRSGCNASAAVVLAGSMGSGRFAVVSSEYVFMANSPDSLSDVPVSQNNMLFHLLSDLGTGFSKKKIGLSCGHDERVNAENFNAVLKQRLALSGVSVTVCSISQIMDCDILIIGAPLQAFTSEEQEALESFVYDGGRVVFCGCGSYWTAFPDKDGGKRKIADYPLNIIGRSFRFSIEDAPTGKCLTYGNNIAQTLFFTPIFHVAGAHIHSDNEQINTIISNAFLYNSDEQRTLARCYRDGIGLLQNYDYALYWYKMSAFAGNAKGQFHLGLCYNETYANGTNFNTRLYKIWLSLAAKNKNLTALLTLGLDTYYGRNGLEKDDKLGAALIKNAANKGDTNAAYHAGRIFYERGNFAEAGLWLTKACESNDVFTRSEAHYVLAFLYRDGKGVKRNLQTAIHHLILSAKEGNKKAISVLGQPDNGFLDDATQDKLEQEGVNIMQILDDL